MGSNPVKFCPLPLAVPLGRGPSTGGGSVGIAPRAESLLCYPGGPPPVLHFT